MRRRQNAGARLGKQNPALSMRNNLGGMQKALGLQNSAMEGHRTIQSSSGTAVISSRMSAHEIATHLGEHGCENITDRLDMSSCSVYPISTGGFGDVYRAMLDDGTLVAVKTMRLLMDPSESGQKHLKHAARELHTWSKCRHPNVVELLGLVEFRGQIGMVSLWINNGNLPSYLAQHHDVDRCQMGLQISEGLRYLHYSNIIHGDLKGANVLISNEGIPMLVDFGNAILQERTLQFTSTTTKVGLSPRWAAPEIIEESGTYSFAADVYALGMTILETITGQVPYPEKRTCIAVCCAVAMRREHPKRPEDCIPPGSQHGNTLWSMLTRCWTYEAEARPQVDDVVDIMKTITQEGLLCPGPVPALISLAGENSMFNFLDALDWDPDDSVGDGMPGFEPAVTTGVWSEVTILIHLGRYQAWSERLVYAVSSHFTPLVDVLGGILVALGGIIAVLGGILASVSQLLPPNWLNQIFCRALLYPVTRRLAAWRRIVIQLAVRAALLNPIVEPENEVDAAELHEVNAAELHEVNVAELHEVDAIELDEALPPMQDIDIAEFNPSPLLRSLCGFPLHDSS